MTQKLQISKAGFNAVTETNSDNLVFSSDYNTLKYAQNGNISLTVNAPGTATATISHGLGYYPFFVVYVNDTSGTSNYNIVPFNNNSFSSEKIANAYVDTSNLYLQFIWTGSGALTTNFYYKIFKNNLGF